MLGKVMRDLVAENRGQAILIAGDGQYPAIDEDFTTGEYECVCVS